MQEVLGGRKSDSEKQQDHENRSGLGKDNGCTEFISDDVPIVTTEFVCGKVHAHGVYGNMYAHGGATK